MPILGTEETIAAFDADFIRAYYERNYHQENIVLSVAGNFEEKEMLGKLNEKLGRWKRETPFVQYDTHAACLEPVNQLSGYQWSIGCYVSPRDHATRPGIISMA